MATLVDVPFTMLRDDPINTLSGNERFEGFIIDLIDVISKVLGMEKLFLFSNGFNVCGSCVI